MIEEDNILEVWGALQQNIPRRTRQIEAVRHIKLGKAGARDRAPPETEAEY